MQIEENNLDVLRSLASHRGAKLRAARAFLGWTLTDAETHSGIDRATISQIEQRDLYRLPAIVALFRAYGRHGVEIQPEGVYFHTVDAPDETEDEEGEDNGE